VPTPHVEQGDVATWFDATYRKKGLSYLRPPRAYPIFLQLLGVTAGQRMLDVACGPGLVLRAARERGVEASGVDLSGAAIELARELLPGIDAQESNAEQLPFEDGVFDGITCLGSLERFLDRDRALSEMVRVAKPTARFCFLVRNASTLIWRVWREGFGNREVKGHQDAKTLEAWRELFARNGLVIEQIFPDQWPRQRWRQLLPGQMPRPDFKERIAKPFWPVRWCNELIFVLRREDVASD
jgi:SAM-dependent methyltransferase